ncbi:MAG: response regulator transcription factor [Gemmatimonadaceae bacterium]|nr:response regulator transcription factor [Gemmatimonadaceae bacterium]
MRKTILLYGILAGALIALLSLIEYRYLVISHSVEIYGALVALVFTAAGLWLGLRLTTAREKIVIREVEVPVVLDRSSAFIPNETSLERLAITARELEILQLIALGLSTKEIAEKVFVSENTVKTHSGRIFEKLNARRRTQAVLLAQKAGIIP